MNRGKETREKERVSAPASKGTGEREGTPMREATARKTREEGAFLTRRVKILFVEKVG